MTAPRPTSTPSSSALPAPTNASSSTMTGRAPGGSRTPPMVTPGREVDPLADLGARADEHVRVDHRVGPDAGPDVDVRRRHHDDAVAEVRPTSHGRAARDDPPRTVGEVVARRDRGAVPERQRARRVQDAGRPIGEAREDRRLHLGADAPAVGRVRRRARRPGPARPRGRRGSSPDRARSSAGRPRSSSVSAVMPPPPG